MLPARPEPTIQHMFARCVCANSVASLFQTEFGSFDVPKGNVDYLELPPLRDEVR